MNGKIPRLPALAGLMFLMAILLPAGCYADRSVARADPKPEAEVASSLAIRDQTAPFPGILAAGQPSAEELRQAAAEGFRTVINLRAPGEEGELPGEEELVRSTGMNYVAIPIGGSDGISV